MLDNMITPQKLDRDVATGGPDQNVLRYLFSRGGAIFLPPGKYRLTEPIPTIVNTPLFVYGIPGQTFLTCEFPVGNGLTVVNEDYTMPVVVFGISFLTNQQEPGDALNITFSAADSIGHRSFERGYVARVEVRGVDKFQHGWKRGIVGTDVHNWRVEKCLIAGRRDMSLSGRAQFLGKMTDAIMLIGSGQNATPSNFVIDTCRVHGSDNAFRSSGHIEGTIISKSTAVAVGTGVKSDQDSTRPWLTVTNSHLNVFDYGVNARNAPQTFIGDNIIYKIQLAENDTTAIRLDNCNLATIRNNQFLNQAGSALVNGAWNGVHLTDCSDVRGSNNVLERGSSTLLIEGSSARNRVSVESAGTYPDAVATGYVDASVSGDNGYFKSSGNAADVNTTNTVAPVATVSIGIVRPGEKFRLTAQFRHVKGSAAGDTLMQIAASGTGSAVFQHNDTLLRWRHAQAPGSFIEDSISGYATVTSFGTLTFRLQGLSVGSDGTVPAGFGSLMVERLDTL